MFVSNDVEIRCEGQTLNAINHFGVDDTNIYYAWYINAITENGQQSVIKQFYEADNSFSYHVNDCDTVYRLIAFVENRKDNTRIAKNIVEFKLSQDNTIEILRIYMRDFSYENVRRVSLEFQEIDSYEFCINEPILYSIMWEGLRFDFLINYIENCKNSVVFGTGAISKEVLSYPVFSRATWLNDIKCTGIWYFDPSLYMYENLRLAWGYGEKNRWALENIAFLLCKLMDRLNLNIGDSVFFGSSGGGTMSIMLATMLHGKAIAINPQLIVENHLKSAVIPFEETVKEKGKLIESRCDVVKHFQREGYIPSLDIYVNEFSENDVTRQIKPFCKELQDMHLDTRSIKLHSYFQSGGHNGMPSKPKTIKIIKCGLDSKPRGLNLPSRSRIQPFFKRAKDNYTPWIDSRLESKTIDE